MKKLLFTMIAVMSLLVMTTGSVLAKSGYLILRETRNDADGGVIFIFEVVGEFGKKELQNGYVYTDKDKYPTQCNLDGNILSCTTSRATAGKYVTIYLNGFVFWTRVPESRGSSGGSSVPGYCYPVYDLEEEVASTIWVESDSHCQDVPANYGDSIMHFSNFFGSSSSFIFADYGGGGCWPLQIGDGYYLDVGC